MLRKCDQHHETREGIDLLPFSTRRICSREAKTKFRQCDWSAKKLDSSYSFTCCFASCEQIRPVENSGFRDAILVIVMLNTCLILLLIILIFESRRGAQAPPPLQRPSSKALLCTLIIELFASVIKRIFLITGQKLQNSRPTINSQ